MLTFMPMKKMRLICFFFLWFQSMQLSAQDLSYRPITTDDGLPSSEVYFSFCDHNGYMWFSTDNGVCHYNGFQFRIFTKKEGMADNAVYHIAEDHKGRIWCDGSNGGICYILNNKVYPVPGSDSLRKYLQGGKGLIRKIHADIEGKVWIATTYNLFWLDEKEDFKICHTQKDIPGKAVDYILVTRDSVALISANPGLNKKNASERMPGGPTLCIDYRGERKLAECSFSKTSMKVSPCAVVTKNGDLIFNYYNIIYRFNASGLDSLTTLPKSPICMFYGKDNTVWVGTMSNGVYCYSKNNFSKPSAHYLDGVSVSGICTDQEGGMWFSTLGKGLMYCPMPAIANYTNMPPLSQKITAIGQTKSGLIFGTNEQRIFSWDMKADSLRELNLFSIPLTLFNVWQDTSWLYLAGSMTASRVNDQFGGIQSYGMKAGIGLYDSLRPSGSYDVAITKSGRRIFISDKFLFELRDTLVKPPNRSSPVTYHVQHFLEELPARSRMLYYTSDDKILVSCTVGLFEYRDETGLTLFDGVDTSLVNRVTDIAEDRDGRLWMATVNKGVVICEKNKTILLTENDTIPFSYCTGIEFDEEGNAWVSTIKGLMKINVNYQDVKKSRIDRFDISCGLISNEILKIHVFRGKLWIGTMKGLCSVDIAEMNANLFAPPVYISAVQVDDSLYSRFDPFPELTYEQKNFRFYLEALSYRGKKTLTYLYKLSGFDKEWHKTNDPILIYQNLPAGDYTLTVIARNNAGVNSAVPAVFNFTVPAPFWETWWFRGLCLLTASGLIFLFVRLRLRQFRLREEEKTRTHKLVSEFQLTALRAQMNPHFIFNAINSIQRFVLQKNSQEAYDYLAKFSRLIRMVLNHSQDRIIQLEEELSMLNLYVELEQLRFTGKFEYHLELDPDIDDSQAHIPSMLIQPYVENAIWHGLMNLRGERNAALTVRVKEKDELLHISIEDNGVGREAARKLARDFTHKSLGMELSRQRFELMNKMPEAEKSSVQIVDLHDSRGNPCGTRVEIIVGISYPGN